MINGEVKTLYTDADRTEAVFPRTVTSAVTDADGNTVEDLIENMVRYDDEELTGDVTINADQLNGHSDTYFAKQSEVTENTQARHTHSNKSILDTITQAMLDLIGTISGKYVKPSSGIPKTDLASAVQTSLGKADTIAQNYIRYTIEEVI